MAIRVPALVKSSFDMELSEGEIFNYIRTFYRVFDLANGMVMG